MDDDEPIVTTTITDDRGQWTVHVQFLSSDGVVQHRMGTYKTRARAELAARIVKATADRDHRPDWGMP